MELTDVLLTFAQAAMVIAGFGGVVIALHDKLDKWSEWDRVQFKSILDISGLVVFFSVLPIVLHSLLSAGMSWRISIVLFALVHAGIIINYRSSVERESIPAVFARAHIVAAVIILSQLISSIVGNQGVTEILYSFGLFWLIGVGGWLFYLLAIGTHLSGEDE